MALIVIKNSQEVDKVPTSEDLVVGELAVNTANGTIYTKHSDGSVKNIGQEAQNIDGGTSTTVFGQGDIVINSGGA